MRRIGRRSSSSAGAAIAASSGSGDVLTYWWASGWSGTGTPASAPTRGPQMPAAQTTMSAGNSPRSVTTAVTRPPVGPDVGDGVARRGSGRRPRSPGAPGPRQRGRPWRGRRSGRDSRRARPRGRASGQVPTHLVGVEEAALDAPRLRQPVAPPQLEEPFGRQRDLEAADLPEAPLPVELERAELLDGVAGELGHRLRAVGLEDEPGGVGRGPAGGEQRALVETVTSVQPRDASSSASEHPTMPAPMITTRGPRLMRSRAEMTMPAPRWDAGIEVSLGLGGGDPRLPDGRIGVDPCLRAASTSVIFLFVMESATEFWSALPST